jgi:hypothetical protein
VVVVTQSPAAPTAPTAAEKSTAGGEDLYADSFWPFVNNNSGVKGVSIAFWLLLALGVMVLALRFLLLMVWKLIDGVDPQYSSFCDSNDYYGSSSSGSSNDRTEYDKYCTVQFSAFIEPLVGFVICLYVWLRACQGCCALCCCPCCPRELGKLRFALLSPFLFAVIFSVLYTYSETGHLNPHTVDTIDVEYNYNPYNDYSNDDDNIFAAMDSPVGLVSMILLIVSWVLWAVLLTLNVITRFIWWRKDHPDGERPEAPETTFIDKFIDWPYIHWIAIGAWGLLTLDILLAMGLIWLGLRVALILDMDSLLFGWSATIGSITPMLVIIGVLTTLVPGQFLARAGGAKTPFSCFSYRSFLFGLIQPLIYEVLLTVVVAIGTSTSANPANLSWEIFATYLTFGEGFGNLEYLEYLGLSPGETGYPLYDDTYSLWSQTHSVGSAAIAFLVISWIGVAGLCIINLLSYFGIRPNCGKPKVAAADQPAPPTEP